MNQNVQSGKKTELLAPAGSYESFQAALAAGADAVYLGGSMFGARAYAKNFSEEELLRAIDEAHIHGRRLYLTLNTLLKDREMEEQLRPYLEPLYVQGLDGVIVQDMGVAHYLHKHFPGLELHASTQMTVTGWQGTELLREAGFCRVVPARELSLQELRSIKDKTGVEVECFVHGALCYSYSGQCLMSSMIGGRSGNRGQCAQPCRLPYRYRKSKGYLLSLKDICTLDLLPELIEAGVDSFKIEGRMKKPEYVSGVVSIYRKYIDLYEKKGRDGYHISAKDRENLLDLYNRGGFHEGYFHCHNGKEMLADKRPNHAGTQALRVLKQQGREVETEACKPLLKGDVLELPNQAGNHTLGKALRKGEHYRFLLPKNLRLQKGTVLNRVRCEALIEALQEKYGKGTAQKKIRGMLRLSPGKAVQLHLECKGQSISCSGGLVQEAENQPIREEQLRRQIQKTGGTPFVFEKLDIQMEGDCFLPMQQLNSLRREALQQLERTIAEGYRRKGMESLYSDHAAPPVEAEKREAVEPQWSVLISSVEQLSCLLDWEWNGRIYLESELLFLKGAEHKELRDLLERAADRGKGSELYLALPHICRAQTEERLRELLEGQEYADLFSGLLLRNLEEMALVRKIGFDKKVITDHNLYVFNRESMAFYRSFGISDYTAPLELNAGELQELNLEDCELLIYGYIPVMLSTQCLEKNCVQCRKHPGFHILSDRMHKEFSVYNCCAYCYNIIYNPEPLALFGEAFKLKKLKARSFRLAFTKEDRGEMEQVLQICKDCFCSEEKPDAFELSHTKGHFRRGIK